MSAMYRDKVRIDGGEPVRASVYVLSTSSNYQKGGDLRETVVSVSLPRRQGHLLRSVRTITHDGREYLVNGYPVAIRSLGRIDHWEITGLRVTG